MTAPHVVGVDLSLTGTGIATADGELTVRTNAADPIEMRLQVIRNAVLHRCAVVPPVDLVVIEDFVTRSPAASTLGMVHGVVRVALTEAGIPFVLVPPATLKKYVCGKGTAKKDDMRMETYKRFGLDIADDNQVDAFGLRAMALDALGHPLRTMPTAQRDSLEKITWPALAVGA